MVDVVDEPDGDAAPRGRAESAADDPRQVLGKVVVVDRDVQRALRRADEGGERVGGVDGLLAAVGQRADVDRSLALYARFAA